MKALLEKLQTWEETATKREKFLIVFVSVLVPLFLFYQFYYVQAKEKINILREDVKKLDLEIKKYENSVKKIKVLEVQMKQRREFLNRIKKILPSEKEIPDILRQISDLAKENNLEIITFEPGKEKSQDYYNIIPLKMEIEGRFSNIVNFLNSIESLQRLVVLNDIKFQIKNNQLNAMTTFYTFKYTGVPLKKKETKKGKKR
ncbi:MAG: Type IV pilus assembly protein PilO [Thermodesulfobacterium sp.]|uniref:Type IV pilus assembly protein PilO n=1 Tax=Candidatus Thermodesulfobacterium syntrophicum TaxID=3060442 RepID=A0AAE3P124_9BACT|nr:Type IV pilus assembly protein PilO [Candidatus Thermodesulfobacterium syntrophicum]